MKIEVTKDHIKRGIKYDACSCPVALAIKASNAMIESVSVSVSWIRIKYSGNIRFIVFDTPQDVVDFIVKFDHRKWWQRKPMPFEFLLPT